MRMKNPANRGSSSGDGIRGTGRRGSAVQEQERPVPANSIVKPSASCAFCQSRSLEPVIDFGEVALAGGFIKPEHFADEPRFPLRVFFCNSCYAVQVVDLV